MRTHDARERAFLREFAQLLGVEEVTSEVLAESLGFDELTPEKLDEWFITEVLGGAKVDASEPAARVVQVDRDEQPPTVQRGAALPPVRPNRRGSGWFPRPGWYADGFSELRRASRC
jgi:hypothetical protein